MHLPPEDELRLVGQVVSHYSILETLGEGGMGIVYKAEDTRLRRPAALKFLPRALTQDHEARKRFIHEAQAASALDHPNIATIYEIDELEGSGTFIAMAYYDADDLRKLIADGPVAIARVVDIACQVACGLARAHERGIVHRDVKPGNILLTSDGQVKIVDFGVAKLSGRTQVTRAGETVGTAAYMAPEQVRSEAVDLRADIWGLGAVMYEMLAGRPPFQADYRQAIFYRILQEEPPAFAEVGSNVPPELARIVERCLKKDPAARYQSMEELRSDLLELDARMHPADVSLSTRPRAGQKIARRVLPWIGALALGVSVFFIADAPRHIRLSWLGQAAMPTERQVAVLPFRNVAGDAESEAFCSGLMETITSKLTQLERYSDVPLFVVPASDVIAQSVKSATDARRTFGVNLVVDGSVHRERDQIRVILSLVDPISQRTLSSSLIDYTAMNGLHIQDEAVLRITEMLRVQISGDAQRMMTAGGTTKPGANEFHLQGRGYLSDYQNADNIRMAIQLFERALEEDSTFALAHAGLAEAYWREFRSTRDIASLQQATAKANAALRFGDEISPVQVVRGNIYLERGEHDNAMRSFQRALEIDPMSADAYWGRARALEGLGRLSEAEDALKKAINLRPAYWAGYNTLGYFYYNHSRYAEAAGQWETVVELAPENSRGFRNLGAAYFSMERYDEAIEMFERSVAIQPNYVSYANLGTNYFHQGRFAEAAEAYSRALEMNTSNYLVWGYLGDAHFWTPGGRSEARNAYREAARRVRQLLEINPKDADALASLALYEARLGRPELARAELEKAVSEDPLRPGTHLSIGTTFEVLGERESALTWVGRAVRAGYSMAEIERSPDLDSLRRDPRYQQIADTTITQQEL